MNNCRQCGLNAELDNDDLCEFCLTDNLKEELSTMEQYPKGLHQCHPPVLTKDPESKKVA